MSSDRPKSIYAKLMAVIADTSAPQGERDAAQFALDRMRARYGDSLDEQTEKQGQIEIRYKNEHERELLCEAARYLGALPYYTTKNGRTLKFIRVKGPEHVLPVVGDLFEFHRVRMARFILLAANGYIAGALPRQRPHSGEVDELTQEESALLLAAYEAGEKNRANKRLPSPRRESAWER